MPRDEPERSAYYEAFDSWALRMWRLARRVVSPIQQTSCPWVGGGGNSGSLFVNDARLRRYLDYGSSSIEPGDDPAEVCEAVDDVCDLLNSDPGMWPETHGYTEDDPEWVQMMDAVAAAGG